MTTISIAMASYNGEAFLHRQLDSLARQAVLPSELIVCDDGSTDSTLSIIADFSRSAPFPVIIARNPKRLGFTANFLQAARMCHGDLIAFCDQDDEWLPHKLHRILQISGQSDALVFAHADEWIDRDGNRLGILWPIDRPYRKYIRMNDFPGHAITIRRQLLDMTANSLSAECYNQVADKTEFGHDVLLLEIASAMSKVVFTSDILVRWRFYPESNSTGLTSFVARPRPRVSLAHWLYPPNLAQRYASAGSFYRKHSVLLSYVLRDLAAFGYETATASAVLTRSMSHLTKQADVMDLRAKFYGVGSRKERLKLMFAGTVIGQYRSARHGGVRIHNALRDAVACILNLNRSQDQCRSIDPAIEQ